MAESEVKVEKTSERVIGSLFAQFVVSGIDPFTGKDTRLVRTADRGQLVELPESEERRLDALGALLPKGAKPEDAFAAHQAQLDEYRGQRGDQEALARHHQRLADAQASDRGDITDVTALSEGSQGDLERHIRENRPSTDDTVALANNDPELAQRVLEAETAANDGSPRAGVKQRLEKIIGGG